MKLKKLIACTLFAIASTMFLFSLLKQHAGEIPLPKSMNIYIANHEFL